MAHQSAGDIEIFLEKRFGYARERPAVKGKQTPPLQRFTAERKKAADRILDLPRTDRV
jgi:hypothetical protein